MHKLKVLVGNNTSLLMDTALTKVGEVFSDLTKENIIIVPDKLSLITEQKIFEKLNIDAYFNISVMGISKFAKMIIDSSGLNTIQCSALSSKLILLCAIQNVANNFKCFSKKYTLSFIDEIFAKIEQIKSSEANVDNLIDEDASDSTKLKFEDLKLIYNEYEKLRGEKLDSGALLQLFNNASIHCDYLKKCNVFFIGFDSVTRQVLNVIKNVALSSYSCLITVVEPNNQSNNRVYDRSFLKSILELENEVDCEYVWTNTKLKNTDANIVQNNLFCRDKTFKQNGYYQINRSSTISNEIDSCVKSINYNLKTKDINFNDIAICAPSSYHEILVSKLDELNIDSYSDQKVPLCNFEPIKLLLCYLNFLSTKSSVDFLNVLMNDFYFLDDDVKHNIFNLINQYLSISTILKYENNLSELAKQTLEHFNNIQLENKTGNIQSFVLLTNSIIDEFCLIENINKFCEKLKQDGHIYLEKQYKQITKKLQDILAEINSSLNGINFTIEEYIEIITKALNECEISGVPTGVNQVQILDYKSFFGDKKYLYVLGLNEGVCPEVLNDLGLISDDEILSNTIKAKLEPTTKIINLRNRYKLLEVICSASEKCYLYYHSVGEDGKSVFCNEFISELKFLFNLPEFNTKLFDNINNKIDASKLMFNAKDIYNANILCKQNESDISCRFLNSTLKDNNNLYKHSNNNYNFDKYNSLFFETNKANISLIESYNTCPKKAFLDKGLKLQRQKKSKIEANIFGTFIHEIAQKFVSSNKGKLGKFNEEQVKTAVDEIVKNVIQKPEYYSINLEENKFLFKMLIKECVRVCTFLNFEQSKSNFKAIYTEKYFGLNSDFKPLEINVNGEKYIVTGIVDRIDVCGDDFRIIDYKTGSSHNDNSEGKQELFYGTKIQLFVYAKAVEQNINKNLFGAFYLPITNKFSDDNKASYHLSGFFEDNPSKVFNCDSDLNLENRKSALLNMELKKPKNAEEIQICKKDNILTKDELYAYLNYAIEIIKTTIKNINLGIIQPSPIDFDCKYCIFNDICEKSGNEGIKRNKSYELKSVKISEIVNATNKGQ